MVKSDAKTALRCRFAVGPADLAECQKLRHRSFLRRDGLDADQFDALSRHLMIERDGVLVCTMRIRLYDHGDKLSHSYTGQFYDLTPFEGPAIEVGRFCASGAGVQQAEALRVALSALTYMVERMGAQFLFGCTSFEGHDPAIYHDALTFLEARFQSRPDHIPQTRASDSFALPQGAFEISKALRQVPPLLKGYLGMNGRVGDRIVIDRDMGTMHVFTRLNVADVPPARIKALRELGNRLETLNQVEVF